MYILIFIFNFHPYEKEVSKALDILNTEKENIIKIKNSSNAINSEALSIVFPELIRWSSLSDLMETSALELLYVQRGKGAANFSIGYFQMKPSFIEDIEIYISSHTNLNYLNYILINTKNEKESRNERIQRMKQVCWQIRYAHVYWLIVGDLYKNKIFKSPKDRVRFFATAYNYGFNRPEGEIELSQKKKNFPHGKLYKGTQLSYGDFSVEFFEKYSQEFE